LNLSNNNGQSSNSGNNGGDSPKKEEYESQIKDLQEVRLKCVLHYPYILFASFLNFIHFSIILDFVFPQFHSFPWHIQMRDIDKENITIEMTAKKPAKSM